LWVLIGHSLLCWCYIWNERLLMWATSHSLGSLGIVPEAVEVLVFGQQEVVAQIGWGTWRL
jgi:hypothetical protein